MCNLRGIGGNTTATVQVSTAGTNAIGENVLSWTTVQNITGWLDLSGGDSRYTSFNAKIQESTHLFIADYRTLDSRITPETSRMIINGKRYDVLMIDNPMEMGPGSQLEFFLKFTGGQ